MKRYENRNFRVSTPELVGTVVFLGLLLVAIFFYGSYEETKGLYNIAKTDVDYIIQAPSPEQVSEIAQLDHIDSATPYYYRPVEIVSGKKRIATNLFIIDKNESIAQTTFSDKLKVKSVSSYSGNVVYVTDDFANKADIDIGDSLTISIDGSAIPFTVAGIYKSDYRQVGGSLLAVLTDDMKNAMKSMKYSGAYIASNDIALSGSYFANDYTPMGNLRTREEFDSDESYKTYLDAHSQPDSTMATFVTSDYLGEVARRNDAKLLRNTVLWITVMVVAYIIILTLISVRSSIYTKSNVLKDIRDNFTIEQETKMYSKYFTSVNILMLISNVIAAVAGMILEWSKIISIPNIIAVIVSIVGVAACGAIQMHKLKNRFMVEQKRYENEEKL